jgi:hypothetical protein
MEFLVLEPIKEKYHGFGTGRKKILSWNIPLFYEHNNVSNWQFPTKEQHLRHLEEFKLWFPEIHSWVGSNNGTLIHQDYHNYLSGGVWTKGLYNFPRKKDAKKFLELWSEHLSLWLHLFKHRNGINESTLNSKYSNHFKISYEGIYDAKSTTVEDENGQQVFVEIPILSGEQINDVFNIFQYKESHPFLQSDEVYDWLKKIECPFIHDYFRHNYYFMNVQDAMFFRLRWG